MTRGRPAPDARLSMRNAVSATMRLPRPRPVISLASAGPDGGGAVAGRDPVLMMIKDQPVAGFCHQERQHPGDGSTQVLEILNAHLEVHNLRALAHVVADLGQGEDTPRRATLLQSLGDVLECLLPCDRADLDWPSCWFPVHIDRLATVLG